MMSLLSARSPLGRLARLPLRLVPAGSVVPVLAGPGRGARWVVGAGPHSCWLGFNEWRKRALLAAAVRAGDVVFDVGANVGSYAVLAAKLVGASGRVIAFEPVPANVAMLRRHLALNAAAQVEVVEAAVWDREGPLHFDARDDRLMGSVSEQGRLAVRGVTLDGVLAAGSPPPACVKIDVEGGEVEVLRGATEMMRSGPVLFVATHSSELRDACRALLAQAGYEVRAIAGAADELVAARGDVLRRLAATGHLRHV